MAELFFCGDFGDKVSQEDKRLIPHIKRFMECSTGDSEFRNAVQQNAAGCDDLLLSRGIFGVDPKQLLPLLDEQHAPGQIAAAELENMPQAQLWQGWIAATGQYRLDWCERSRAMPSGNRRFDQWRQRQENRCRSQLTNATNEQMSHTTIAFELSQGCSLQCPFCGLASEPLREVYLYTKENAKLWRDVLQVAVDRLGCTVGHGICYWATDPSDNPDYLRFIQDFGDVTGEYPQATTAAPLRNISWTRELLKFRQEHMTAADRFSILTPNMLRRVHAAFTAEELAFTTLILQYSDKAKQTMAQSGRNRKDIDSKRPPVLLPDHTIACCTGYLVNVANRSAQLITPCPPSIRWPLGYRIIAEGRFSCAAEFGDFITQTIDSCMPETVEFHDVLAFRRDLHFTPTPQGFQLRNQHRVHTMEGALYLTQLGSLIAQAKMTAWDIVDTLSLDHDCFLDVVSSIQELFDKGLLEDEVNDTDSLEVDADGQHVSATR